MGKAWHSRRRGDEKDLNRWLGKGQTVYIVRTPQYAGRSALWNHPRYWTAYTCTGQHPILGGWIFDNSPTSTVSGLFVLGDGTIYDAPPAGVPHLSDPVPDCRDEGLHGYGIEQKDGIDDMERLGAEAKHRYKEDRTAGRRGRWF